MSDYSFKIRTWTTVPPEMHGAEPSSQNDDAKVASSPMKQPRTGQVESEQVQQALMQQLANGSEAAMSELVARYGTGLARLTGRLLAWSSDHEDVFQEVLLTVWQKASSFRGTGNLEGWLKRITINHCRNHLKRKLSRARKWRRFFNLKDKTSGYHNPATQTAGTGDALQQALARLDAQDRTVLVLFYLEEMTGNQVAETLGLRTDHVHVRLNRARNKLKQIMNTKGNDHEVR